MLDQAQVLEYLQRQKTVVLGWLTSPQFYLQLALIAGAVFLGMIIAGLVLRRVPMFRELPRKGRFLKLQQWLYSCRSLVRPLLLVLLLGVAVTIAETALESGWLIRLAQSIAVITLLYEAITRFLHQPLVNAAARWVGLPAATLYVFGLMPPLLALLDNTAFAAGNIRISVLTGLKAGLFGGILFWAGRISSAQGQRVIRKQKSIDIQTRELAAKGFDLAVIAIAVVLLMNLLGMDLSMLAVFSGAVGVGLGFGLQQIASNFISGVIILLERSLKLGDFIELEDGKSGTLTALNMRSSTLATFDGKEIMVPNERFITTRFINWTHTDPRQRYEIPFALPYDTDVRKIPPLIKKAMMACACVLDNPEPPECAFKAFGDAGLVFTAKFWANGVDDGKNSFTSEVGMVIWEALKAANIPMRHPTREVHIIEQRAPRKTKT